MTRKTNYTINITHWSRFPRSCLPGLRGLCNESILWSRCYFFENNWRFMLNFVLKVFVVSSQLNFGIGVRTLPRYYWLLVSQRKQSMDKVLQDMYEPTSWRSLAFTFLWTHSRRWTASTGVMPKVPPHTFSPWRAY